MAARTRLPVWRLACLLTATAIFAAGCGDDDTTDATAADTAAPSAPTSGTPDGSTGAPTSIAVGDTSLGPVLIDGDGMTLYLFTPDDGGAPTCDGSCAERWPPVTVDGDPVAGDGVDASLLDTTERPDGSTQVAYAGHPLYRYALDNAPGDVNGQGVDDVWFAVDPDGTAVEGEPPAPARPGY